MRKSDRIRALELQVVELKAHLDVLSETLLALIDIRKIENESLDAGKWYNKNNK